MRSPAGVNVDSSLSLWRSVSLCPISYHKSTGGRSSSRWRAGRATSSRRRNSGRSRRVAAASRRSGRSARRAGPTEARFVHVVDLAKQSGAMVFAWWNPCTMRPHRAADGGAGGETEVEQGWEARFVNLANLARQSPILSNLLFFKSLCGQARPSAPSCFRASSCPTLRRTGSRRTISWT